MTGPMWTCGTSYRALLVTGLGFVWRLEIKGRCPLEPILWQIKKAIEAKLYYLALAVALSIPDICSTLEWDPDPNVLWANRGRQSKRYKHWFDTYLKGEFTFLTADDCYSIRCGVLHQGSVGRPDDQYDQLAFLIDSRRREFLQDGNIIISKGRVSLPGRVLTMGLDSFCEKMADAAHRWWDAKWHDPYVRANLPNLVREHSRGTLPLVGEPWIG